MGGFGISLSPLLRLAEAGDVSLGRFDYFGGEN
jgi:hypothetical protein